MDERLAVQDPLISYAIEIGWTPLSRDEATTLRRGETGTLLYSTLRQKLIDLNPGIVTVENVDGIVDRIESVRTNIEGNAEILKWLRGQQSAYVESERRERNAQVIDFDRRRVGHHWFRGEQPRLQVRMHVQLFQCGR